MGLETEQTTPLDVEFERLLLQVLLEDYRARLLSSGGDWAKEFLELQIGVAEARILAIDEILLRDGPTRKNKELWGPNDSMRSP